MRLKIALKDEVSSISVSGTKAVIGPTETDSAISPKELFYDLLKPTNTLPGLQSYLVCSLGGARRVSREGL